MLEWTDRHCRNFLRSLSRRALLYTEMVSTGAILHGDVDHHLAFAPEEHPVALQLGGSNATDLAKAAKIGAQYQYDEINLNCGCPSDRVQNAFFGACLMKESGVVADGVKAMRDAVDIPVTVKIRTGVDELDSYEFMRDFVASVAERSGCNTFIVHARKAWLQGLSPKQNREIPPLDYSRVYRLKQELPQLEIVINGGIKSLAETSAHLQQVDGVMMGREVYQNPWVLHGVDSLLFGQSEPSASPAEALHNFLPYVEQQLSAGVKLHHITRHILGMFQGMPGAKQFRRHLSENAYQSDAGIQVIIEAMTKIREPKEALYAE